MEFNYANIPQELKRLRHWVCWGDANADFENMSHQERQKQKLPKNPQTGGNAMANNSSTWGSFIEALSALKKYNFKGIGFMLGEGYFGVDLDNCDNELKTEFVDTLQSYSEYSMSGNGIHIICKGTLPEGQRRKGNIEMYEKERYFIMTGNKINNYQIVECSDKIKPLYTKYLYTPVVERAETILDYIPTGSDMLDVGLQKDNKLIDLWYSTPSGSGGDESETDLALISKIAYWCNGDFNSIKNRFLESPYYNKKDNYHRAKVEDRDDYITNTINLAIRTLNSTALEDNTKYRQNLENQRNTRQIEKIIEQGDTIVDEETGEVKKLYENNDTGNAKRLADRFGHLIRYNNDNNDWYIYDGRRWKVDDTLEIKRLADLIVDDVKKDMCDTDDKNEFKDLARNYDRLASSKGKESMIKETEHLNGIPVTNNDFDQDKMYFNVKNGVIDLRDGSLIEHSSDMNLSKISMIDYDPNATCPRWLQFLDEIFLGDKELIEWIQMSVGYSMTGSTKEQSVYFCYGEGSNGKSVFLDTIKNLMGSYGANSQPETIMSKKNGNAELGGDVARLNKVRFVSTVETNQGDRINESLLKQMTGEDTLVARFLYGKPFEFVPQFKMWMATNHEPTIRGRDNGIWRRPKLIPFKATFTGSQVDKDLKYKLNKEMSGILNWAIEGCIKWQTSEYKTPKCVELSTKEYRKEMDILQRFCDEVVMEFGKDSKVSISSTNLFNAYRKWAKENNEWDGMTSAIFGKEISKFYEKKRTSSGNVYLNIDLKPEFAYLIEERKYM